MLSTLDLSMLLEPVTQRANARFASEINGFSDRSARFVLQRLGQRPIGSDDHFIPNHPDHWRLDAYRHIERCAWIDYRLRLFFSESPTAECIEVDNGLSTRFHRLSEELDWPRFSWRAINTDDVNDCLQYVFPKIDNHQRIGCQDPQHCWQKHVPWNDGLSRILILGEQSPLSTWEEFLCLSGSIESALTQQAPHIDIIVTHRIKNFSQLCLSHNKTHFIVSAQQKPERLSLMTALLNLLNIDRSRPKTSTHQLRIVKPETLNAKLPGE